MKYREAVPRDVKFLMPIFVDLRGVSMTRLIRANEQNFRMLVEEGTGFGGAAMIGMGQGPHEPALLAKIDPETGFTLPWDKRIRCFFASLWDGDQPHPYCTRHFLQRTLADAQQQGYRFNVGFEFEHFLVNRQADGSLVPWDPEQVEAADRLSFTARATLPATAYLTTIMDALNKLGWNSDAAEKEEGPGQFEVNLAYQDAVTTADRFIFFRLLAAEVAKGQGAVATFMPKPFADRTGSGLHFHYHLARGQRSLFAQPRDPLGLSPLAYQFIGGIIEHAAALAAFTNPTINCYKRLASGKGLQATRSGNTWTPTGICYGGNNRTVMIRTVDGHCEDRSPSPLCNPYLALAAYLIAGLDGIKQKRDPGKPQEGNLYEASPTALAKHGIRSLPATLTEATSTLQQSQFFKKELGVLADETTAWQKQQIAEQHRQISRYEVENYLHLR